MMKKVYITLLSIMILAFPGVVNALEFENCPATIKVDNEETLKLKDYDGDINLINWITSSFENATVNQKDSKIEAVVKGVKKGKVTITANNGTDQVSCDIEVEEAPAPTPTPTPDSTPEPTDKPTATPKEVTDFTLKRLEIEGGSIEPEFNKDVTAYTLTIKDFDKLKVTAKANDESAEVIISGYSTLSTIEKNGIKITVTDSSKSCENDKCKVYTLKLPKKEENVNLSLLELKAYPFNETFSKDVTEYTATIPYEVEEVTLEAIAEDKDNAKVTTSSLKNLQVGGNKITVTVKNGDSSKTYTIYVTRSEKEKLDEKVTSIIDSTKTTGSSKESDYDIPDVDSPDSVFNIIIVTLTSFMLFAAGGIGIYFFIKTSPKRLKKEVFKKNEEKKASPLVEAKPNKEK